MTALQSCKFNNLTFDNWEIKSYILKILLILSDTIIITNSYQ